MRIVTSIISPPGTVSTGDEKDRNFYVILVNRAGEKVEYRRGWTTRKLEDHLKEAFPDGCAGCVGQIEYGTINEDGSRRIRGGVSTPRFYEYHGVLCWKCVARRKTEAVESIRRSMSLNGVTMKDLAE